MAGIPDNPIGLALDAGGPCERAAARTVFVSGLALGAAILTRSTLAPFALFAIV